MKKLEKKLEEEISSQNSYKLRGLKLVTNKDLLKANMPLLKEIRKSFEKHSMDYAFQNKGFLEFIEQLLEGEGVEE